MSTTIAGADGNLLATNVVGDGVPVVFVHGSSGGLTSWDPVAAHLRDEFATITYARSAYPPSRRGSGPMTFAGEVDDLIALVEATCDQPPHLVGGSYGATVALHAAVDAPTAWRTVSVFEPPLFAAGPALRPVLERYLDEIERQHYATAAWLFGTEVALMPPEVLGPRPEEHTATRGPGTLEEALAAGCAADLEAMASDTVDLQRWQAIDARVLLMHGEHTWPPMPATMESLSQVLPQSAQVVVLPGQSHFATHTAPKDVADHLRAFFRSAPAP